MKNKSFVSLLLAVAMTMTLGAGFTFAAHPDIPLYTYEEIGMQFTPNFNPQNPGALIGTLPNPNAAFNMMPVMINGDGKGFPYSPKQTCGNCHNGTTARWDTGQPITDANGTVISTPLVSYDEMNDKTFHAELGAEEWQHYGDNATSATADTSQGGKPWSSTNGMWGKW